MRPTIGILMLDTEFERPPGDIGNEKTFSFSVLYERVEHAYISEVVLKNNPDLLEKFISAAQRLEQRGANAITTSCGFLAFYQKEIQEHLLVPFYSSSLLQVPLAIKLTGAPAGIITASGNHLTEAHLVAAGIDPEMVYIIGMDDMPSFTDAIILETKPLDQKNVAAEMEAITRQLLWYHPEIRQLF